MEELSQKFKMFVKDLVEFCYLREDTTFVKIFQKFRELDLSHDRQKTFNVYSERKELFD